MLDSLLQHNEAINVNLGEINMITVLLFQACFFMLAKINWKNMEGISTEEEKQWTRCEVKFITG